MRRLSLPTKALYGAGHAIIAALETTHLYYFVPFFTLALGVPGSLVGLAAFIGTVLDAFADPAMGHYSDEFRSRFWGRRHLFMLLGVPLFSVFLLLLFNPPNHLNTTQLFVWLLTFSTLTRLAVTLNYIPYLSLGAELSSDYDERTSIANYRTFFSYALGTTISFVFWIFFIRPSPKYPTGWTDPAAYGRLGLLAAAVALVGGLIAVLGTFRYIPQLPEAPAKKFARPWYTGYIDILKATRKPSFRSVMGGWIGLMTLVGAHAALITTVNGYYWGLTSTQQFLTVAAYSAATLPGMLLASTLCKNFEKRTAAIVGVLGFVVFHVALYGADFANLLPARGTNQLVAIMISMLTCSLTFVVSLYTTVFSMIADVTDDLELSTGRRQEGVVFAASSFGQKVTNGLGGLFAGVGLDLINLPLQTDATDVPTSVLRDLGVLMGFAVPSLAIIPILAFSAYRIGRNRLHEIQRELAELSPQARAELEAK